MWVGRESAHAGLTFVYYTLETCSTPLLALWPSFEISFTFPRSDVRITLKSLAETAAAAIVQRMMMRRRPLVFLLVRPRSKGSTGDSVAITATKGKTTRRRKEKEMPREKVQCAGKSLWIGCRILVDRWSRKSMPSPPPPQRSLAYGPFSLLKGLDSAPCLS